MKFKHLFNRIGLPKKDISIKFFLFSISMLFMYSTIYSQSDICSSQKDGILKLNKRFIYQSDGFKSFTDVIDTVIIDNLVYYKTQETTSFFTDTLYNYYRIDSLGFFIYDKIYEKHVLVVPKNQQQITFTIEEFWGKTKFIDKLMKISYCGYENLYKISYGHTEWENDIFIEYFNWDFGFICSSYNNEYNHYLIEITTIPK